MKKKILKIVGGVFLVIILLLVAAPFFLKGKIAGIIKEKVIRLPLGGIPYLHRIG